MHHGQHNQRQHRATNGGDVETCADGHAHSGSDPEAGGSGETHDLVLIAEDEARAEETDAGDDSRGDTGRVNLADGWAVLKDLDQQHRRHHE